MAFKSAAQRKWFFANGGSSSSGGKYKSGTDPIKTLVKQDKKAIEKAISKGNKTIMKDKERWEKIQENRHIKNDSKDKFTKNDKYNQKRLNIHNKLIEKVDNPNAIPKKDKIPKVVFIGGLSASGKTSTVAKFLKRKEGEPDYKAYPGYVYLNSDNFKTWLPEYSGYNAPYLHEESTDIFERAIKQYAAQGKNIIIDATLKTTPKAKDKMDFFKKKGYKVKLLGTNIPGEKAIERATGRFIRSKRYVPLEIIGKNAEKTNASVLTLRHNAKDYAVYNTDVERGKKPVLVESDESLKKDRERTANEIVDNEKEWREKGTDKVDLKGYDTKKHKKVTKFHTDSL